MFSVAREALGNHRSLLTKRLANLATIESRRAYLAHAHRLACRRDDALWIERELIELSAKRYVPKIDMRSLRRSWCPVWKLAGR
ncbi:MAG: hypothetical protein AUH08_12450 [Verrucomicrobia bacterium 13_2_20CM_54_12]|jgi:hypothetical protein|nr:MAG: hypothetical protein AUH08_12450 [Verrucomicrobia bacterium 13_2_20CM_54_12]OLD87838.1 MAG: hypothetical protein AUG81_07925 [Verrucomicrobia bacterium 13_1_20CM_4_54_11]OLE12610.1 MAG: hypothetical protein AUG52_03370 [Verrucomicrobia bacterium 13_1_20CM_3_54_17]